MVYLTPLCLEWLSNLLTLRFMINMLDNTDFGMKVDFSGGGQTGELGDKPSKSD